MNPHTGGQHNVLFMLVSTLRINHVLSSHAGHDMVGDVTHLQGCSHELAPTVEFDWLKKIVHVMFHINLSVVL